jgi:glutamate-1-semialdehyde aminotransferase
MARRGVLLPPSPFETWFPGMAHDEAVLGQVLEAVQAAAAVVAEEPTSD